MPVSAGDQAEAEQHGAPAQQAVGVAGGQALVDGRPTVAGISAWLTIQRVAKPIAAASDGQVRAANHRR